MVQYYPSAVFFFFFSLLEFLQTLEYIFSLMRFINQISWVASILRFCPLLARYNSWGLCLFNIYQSAIYVCVVLKKKRTISLSCKLKRCGCMVDSRNPNTSVIITNADQRLIITIQTGNNLIIRWFHLSQPGRIGRLVGQLG